ncbi:UTP--GlnB (protein PII) uridylyltransferase GlnD [Cricetibacter osteomyelitidis]|uniref:Bifunctional uridylyltransferase/uridylyl-removing enzyme n=1 Tax=Cricetibacter osteomyelitidis TaxID=1521931 RepID=A0A4R2TAB0_9PAST|nr:bifunctional uridylyltransferase/uridylyl-removing protein GlnD [Cricetibacter osteomyelitidis]TCP97814.1 UTP--GlnB (protein PII) uridylyltransferase GlnD [Cricetibacter osteomyelitidis]
MFLQYQSQNPLTPSAVKLQLDLLKQWELERFEAADVYDLIENRTRFYDHLLITLWQFFQLDQEPDLTLIAVGGYGRKEMFPLSDLDFLILSINKPSEPIARKISEFVQFLWDCRLDVGQSVRTLNECMEVGKADITVATNLLESRYLCGNRPHFEQLDNAVHNTPDFWPIKAFFDAKIQERTERYQRYHNTGYNLEPDIKYSPGGLRDLHLLYWIALRHSRAKTLDDILNSGFIYPQEYESLLKSQSFLFRTRFALHLMLKRYDNRLLFDRQLKVSEMLGFTGQGNQAVEAMMKQFFQSLQAISLLSDMLAKHYQENFLKPAGDKSAVKIDENFECIDQMICLRNPKCFVQQPATIIDLFLHLTAHLDWEIHSSTLRQLPLALTQLKEKLSNLPAARIKFLLLLAQPNAIARALMPMHRYGVLTAYLRKWQGIEGLMQFDLFHNYTVDEHTLRVMAKLECFLDSQTMEQHPVCCEIFPKIDRTLLYLAALFHDIAKGRGGDHAVLGAVDMRDFAERHGFNEQDTELMVWLVEQHLLMSVTAQRRDIHDPEIIRDFADKIKTQKRLDYLMCLTVADICATNATLWNSWKRSLLASLYQFTTRQLQQGTEHLLDQKQEANEHRKQALKLLAHINPEKITALWARCPDDYFLRNTAKQIAWHTELLCESHNEILVKISNRFSLGGTEVFVYCPDQPNLFNKVVNIIDAKNFSIHDAQIITSLDGYVLDSFIVTELDGTLAKFDRRRALEQALLEGLSGEKKVTRAKKYKTKLQHFHVATEVQFLNTEKSDQTELEIITLDKAGLLADISDIFTELNLNLLNAKITTNGERAEDFFILTNQFNEALTVEQRDVLERKLKDI